MHRVRATCLKDLLALVLSEAGLSIGSPAAAQVTAPEPRLLTGRNVNMAGGTQVIRLDPYEVRGDVLGRAQNESSCAISTRNPQHILCGTGRWNGRDGYTFEAQASDQSELGRGRDTFSLVIRDAQGMSVANVSGALTGGNIQSTRVRR